MDYVTLANQAVAAFQSQNRDKAVSLLSSLIAQKAPLGTNWGQMVHIASSMGECTLAIKSGALLAASNKDDTGLQIQAATIMAQAGKVEQAYQFLKPLLLKNADDPVLNHFIGTLQSQLGDMEASLESLRRTLTRWKTSGVCWMTLASLKKFTKEDDDLKAMLAVQDEVKSTAPDNYAAYLYAAAKALADIGDVPQSFKLYKKAADIMHKLRPFNMQAEKDYANTLIKGFSPQNMKTLTKSYISSDIPIFIVGYPRSGTTLVEQILTSHKDVANGGEINLFRTAALPMKGFTIEHAQKYEASFENKADAWKEIADTYLHLLNERFGSGGRIVDKSLNNSHFIGLIRHIFPKSPIIWMRRTPIDSAWSCYKTFFASSLDWAWSLKDIAASFKIEDELHKHWTNMYPGAILDVPYEELVRNKELWIPKILDHCGLAEDQGVYDFHQTKRAVMTSSVAQVRGPMTTAPIGSSEPYREYLSEFTDTYAQK